MWLFLMTLFFLDTSFPSRFRSRPSKYIIDAFYVADTQLYKRLRPSVGPLARWSVGPSVMVIESKSGKMSVFDTFCVCLSVEGGLGCEWGLDAPAQPSATIL